MRVLFCHDGPLRKDEFNNYYGNGHNNETLKRYLNIADNLSVLMRTKNILKKEAELTFSKITIPSLEIIECPNISSLKGMLLNRWKSKTIIKDAVLKSDYIVARLPSFFGMLAIDFAKEFGKPYLIEVVACPWDALWNHSFKGKLMAPFMYCSTKRLVDHARYVIYVTSEFLQKRYPTKGKSVSCSNVSLMEFEDNVLLRRLNKIEMRTTEDKLIIGTTAAVNVRYKGQQYIIKALGMLKKQGITNIEYQLVGGGDQEFLKSIAKKNNVQDKVKFLGSMPHTKVFEWLETIDIYVQPSRQEGLPRALIEAMSRGLPAFGARTAGIPELIDPEFLFSNTPNNINEICNILLSFEKTVMRDQSKRNFYQSQKYDKTTIEKRRKQFFEEFKAQDN